MRDLGATHLGEKVPDGAFGEVETVPTATKAVENMTKHLTRRELELRREAQAEVVPDRGREAKLEKPSIMAKNPAAGRYWKKVLARMNGLVILDDLDSDVLGVYCVAMARYEQLCKSFALASQLLKDAQSDPDAVAEAMARIESVSGKMQGLEKNILSYAEKLGLTPSGRVRLAQRRAEQAAVAPDGDLFGD